MRTILSFAFAFLAAAQPKPAPNTLEMIDRQEKRLVDTPDDVQTRVNLIKAYFGKPTGLAVEKAQDSRRRHVLWLIEHHPEAADLRQPFAMVDDTQDAWEEQALKPDAAAGTLQNASAILAQMNDVARERSLVAAIWKAHPDNSSIASVEGSLDVLTMVGATRKENPRQITVPDPLAAKSLEAARVRREIESSTDAALLSDAGRQMTQIAGYVTNQSILGDEDPLMLALGWTSRAHEIDPSKASCTEALMQVYQALAGATVDSRGKVQWLEKASALADTDPVRLNILPDLMNAELDAGDDAAAERDAAKVLVLADANPKRGNHDDLVHAAHTVLGRAAFDRGDIAAAKDQLLQSARVKGSGGLANGGPRLTLAQELYDHGEHAAVVEYLEACRAFWSYDQGKLDHYLKLARSGATRDVFANWNPPGMALVGHSAPAVKSIDRTPGKPVAYVFFEPSCKVCNEQIASLRKEAAKSGLNVVGVGANAEATRAYEVETLPTLVVIDSEGLVGTYRVGRIAPGQEQNVLKAGITLRTSAPVPAAISEVEGKIRLAWAPVDGALSYVVEWEPREGRGWPSDKDGLLRVIPTKDPQADLEFPSPLRWRVYAVNRSGPGASSAWQELSSNRLQ